MTTLVIAEKPQLGAVIAQAIGIKKRGDGYYECSNGYIVTWAIGHLLELEKPEAYNPNYKIWNFDDLPLKLRPLKLRVKDKTEKQFKIVQGLLKNANTVINGGDFDDEGQLLIRQILDFCNYQGKVLRIIINDLNTEAVRKALNNLKPDSDFDGMYKKALARSQADFLFGINLSRAYTITSQKKGVNELFSVGRVQTPTLGLIVKRYLDNKNHQATYFYKVLGSFNFGDIDFTANLSLTENISTIDNKIVDESEAKKVLERKNKEAFILEKNIKRIKKSSPLPFSLLDLQAKLNNEHGYSADKTLQITQSLREKHKAITYNRSDCRYLSTEQLKEAPKTIEFINSIFKTKYQFDANNVSRAFNDDKVTAHTGIIPVNSNFKLEDLTTEESIVYEAIVKQYVIQFLAAKINDVCYLNIKSGDYHFKTSANKLIDAGWTDIIDDEDKSESLSNDSLFTYFSSLTDNKPGKCIDVKIDKEKTKPLPIYTDATLLKDLQRVARYVDDPKIKELLIAKDDGREGENGGIGTPATRSAIIKNLNEKGFFDYEGKKIIPTEKGIHFISNLPDEIVKPDMTATWFEEQLEIEKGNIEVDQFLDGLESFIKTQIEKAKEFDIELKGEPCKACGDGVMILKKSKNNNNFLGCSNYPECKTTQSIINNKPMPDCPCCGNNSLRLNSKALSCQCGLTAWRTIAKKNITEAQLYLLVTKGKTHKINGFKSKEGKDFSAALLLDKKLKKINFLFSK